MSLPLSNWGPSSGRPSRAGDETLPASADEPLDSGSPGERVGEGDPGNDTLPIGPEGERIARLPGLSGAGTVGGTEPPRTLELREERLVAHKELRELGEIEVRTEVDHVPGRLEVDAVREEVEVEHQPVGQVVSERKQPWEEDGVLVVPIYEEQLVVTKRLVLREQLRVRRVATTQRQLFEDTLRRERLVVEDPQQTGLVHEQYPTGDLAGERPSDAPSNQTKSGQPAPGGFFEHLVRKALE